MAKCKSCDAPIIWALTIAGRRMPVDPAPSKERGTVLLVALGDPENDRPQIGAHGWLALMVTSLEEQERLVVQGSAGILHESHFATCPDADEHRKAA